MPMNNIERAEHAGAAITEYLASKGEPHDQKAQPEEISDLICDLLHHADTFGFSTEEILRTAKLNYDAENKDEEIYEKV